MLQSQDLLHTSPIKTTHSPTTPSSSPFPDSNSFQNQFNPQNLTFPISAVPHRKRTYLYNDDDPVPEQTIPHIPDDAIKVHFKCGMQKLHYNTSYHDLPCEFALEASANDELMEDSRMGIDIVCMLDISGSMNGQKLDLCKETLGFLASSLQEYDRFALVLFNHLAFRHIRLTTCTEQNMPFILSQIEEIQAFGGTDMEAGFECAVSMLCERNCRNRVSVIMLLTDGVDRNQRSAQYRAQEMLRKFSAEQGELIIHSFGYGTDHDSLLLSSLSERYLGNYYFIENLNDIGEAFKCCLGEIVNMLANKIEVSFGDEDDDPFVQISKIYCKDNKIPPIGLGQKKSMIFTIDIPEIAEDVQENPKLKATVKFNMVNNNSTITKKLDIPLKFEDSKQDSELIDLQEDVIAQYYRVKTAEAIKQSWKFASKNELKQAFEILHQMHQILADQGIDEQPIYKILISDIIKCKEVLSPKTWHNGGSGLLLALARRHSQTGNYYPVEQTIITDERVKKIVKSIKQQPFKWSQVTLCILNQPQYQGPVKLVLRLTEIIKSAYQNNKAGLDLNATGKTTELTLMIECEIN